MSKLNDKQKAFCLEYLIEPNATQAALKAGYSRNGAEVTGSKLLRNINVQNYLSLIRSELQRRTDISNEKIIAEYERIAFARLTDFVSLKENTIKVKPFEELTDDQKAALCEVSQRKEFFKVKLHDKLRALDSLSKIFGLFDGIDEGATEEYIRGQAAKYGLDPDAMVAQVFDLNVELEKRRKRIK